MEGGQYFCPPFICIRVLIPGAQRKAQGEYPFLRFSLGGKLQVELFSAVRGCGFGSLGNLDLAGAGAVYGVPAANAGKGRQDQDQKDQ